jgi:hypothetical protein
MDVLKRFGQAVRPYLFPVAMLLLALACSMALRIIGYVPEAHSPLHSALAFGLVR